MGVPYLWQLDITHKPDTTVQPQRTSLANSTGTKIEPRFSLPLDGHGPDEPDLVPPLLRL